MVSARKSWHSCAMQLSITLPPRPAASEFGTLLRTWRRRRRLSQLSLSGEANVSSRHLSFLESGHAAPSREMVLRLAECLGVPPDARNAWLVAAGFAPLYTRTPLEAAQLAPVREALTRMMHANSPAPALLLDTHWNVIDANRTGTLLLGGDWHPGVSLIDRLVDHPALRAPILNWPDVAAVMMSRLRSEYLKDRNDPRLDALADRLYEHAADPLSLDPTEAILTLRYQSPVGELSLFTTIAELSSAQDLTLRELRLEIFFPADAESKARLEQLAGPQD
jgi:transcriptional regulator with XRE-family HTH domain